MLKRTVSSAAVVAAAAAKVFEENLIAAFALGGKGVGQRGKEGREI